MDKDGLSIVDKRTNTTYEIPFHKGTIRAMDLRKIKTGPDDFGLMTYDPAFMNTASCHSAITFIDGDKGILRYRGYPIEQLAEKCTFLEVAYLLLQGELPTAPQLKDWVEQHHLSHHAARIHQAFPGGLSLRRAPHGHVHQHGGGAGHDLSRSPQRARRGNRAGLQIYRLIGKVPTIAAYTYRHGLGYPYVYPDNDLSYTENFMNMLWRMAEPKYRANPVLARALDILFILHADHEQNCSANVMRSVGSSQADPFVATAAAAAALSGPLHGGANEEVLKMLDEIGSKDRVPAYIEGIKAGKGKLMGFGHRVYKNYDPRARIIKQTAEQVFEVTGKNSKLDIALELERIALEDDYFVKRKLYPNVDFYSGIIYQAMGFRPEMFTVLFAIPRTAGWLAQWEEMIRDPEQKIARPRQIYTGHEQRDVLPMEEREAQKTAGVGQ